MCSVVCALHQSRERNQSSRVAYCIRVPDWVTCGLRHGKTSPREPFLTSDLLLFPKGARRKSQSSCFLHEQLVWERWLFSVIQKVICHCVGSARSFLSCFYFALLHGLLALVQNGHHISPKPCRALLESTLWGLCKPCEHQHVGMRKNWGCSLPH